MTTRLFRCASLGLLLIASAAPLVRGDELFVSDRASNRILAFDPDSGAFTRVVSDSPLLSEPTGLTMGPGGFLYVANLQSDAVKIDPVTGDTTVFATGTAGAGGVAYEPVSNSLFISEFGQFDGDDVFQYDSSGNRVNTITTDPAMPTGRTGMTFDGSGNLYVGTFANDEFFSGTVLKFDAANNYAPLGTFASGSGLAGANGLTFDADGDLLVTSLIGQGVIKFDVESGAVAGGAAFGSPIAYPSGILALPSGDLLVTSLGNDNPADPIYGNFVFPGGIFRYTADGARFSFLVGDFDSNLTVGPSDLVAWSAAFGESGAADADGDGASDGADFLAWQRSVGNAGLLAESFQPTDVTLYIPVAEVAAVPEPASLALVALAGLAMIACRRVN